ncbi:MAG TPA: hypothetical protein VGU25_09685 [Acidobacteriaceae bacterium]|nr:hypothetical protein [Acidobacteriaceae bacterium]
MKTRFAATLGLSLTVIAPLLSLFFIFHARPLPSFGDYVEWTYHGVLLRDLLSGHPQPAYLLKHYPVPNSLTTVGLGILMLVLPWKLAAKVWLVCEIVLGILSAFALQRAARSEASWHLPVFISAVVLGLNFWAGFTNFMFGLYFAMLLCSLLLKESESRWKYGLLLTLAFFSHLIPCAFATLALFLYAVDRRRLRLLWQIWPVLLLTAGYFVGKLLHGNVDAHAGMVASVSARSPAFVAFKINTFLKGWGFINPALGPSDSVLLKLAGSKIFILLFAANAVVALAMFLLLSNRGTNSLKTHDQQRFLWHAIIIFFGCALLMPGAAAGISDPGARMMQIAVWPGILLLTTRSRWASSAILFCAALLLAANVSLIALVANHPPQGGLQSGLQPHIREFAHVYYADRWGFCDVVDRGVMNRNIYPTAIFLKR